MKAIAAAAVLLAAGLAWSGCSSENNGWSDDAKVDGDGGPVDFSWDIPYEEAVNPDVYGSITGTVMSPASSLQYQFPIPKALVYVLHDEPAGIPKRNYCDQCVDLPDNTPYAFTDSHGTFLLDKVAKGEWNLVVQKGQFRRVRKISVRAGETLTVPTDMTTLPNHNDEGQLDTIPRIMVASGQYDWIEDLLAKFGLAELGSTYQFVKGSEEFALSFNGGRAYGTGYEAFKDFLKRPLETPDQDDLSDFNILFIPCSDGHYSDDVLSDPVVQENLRTFVKEGGKLYVSDWSYDFIETVFPAFINFVGESGTLGSAEDAFEDFWDTTGNIRDADMTSWLVGLGLNPAAIDFKKNWVAVNRTDSVPGQDENGDPVDIVPVEYILGTVPAKGEKPLNIVFDYGCGKVLYTTYHTIGALTGARPDIIPQEKILLYLVLDISVCSGHVVIPI